MRPTRPAYLRGAGALGRRRGRRSDLETLLLPPRRRRDRKPLRRRVAAASPPRRRRVAAATESRSVAPPRPPRDATRKPSCRDAEETRPRSRRGPGRSGPFAAPSTSSRAAARASARRACGRRPSSARRRGARFGGVSRRRNAGFSNRYDLRPGSAPAGAKVARGQEKQHHQGRGARRVTRRASRLLRADGQNDARERDGLGARGAVLREQRHAPLVGEIEMRTPRPRWGMMTWGRLRFVRSSGTHSSQLDRWPLVRQLGTHASPTRQRLAFPRAGV